MSQTLSTLNTLMIDYQQDIVETLSENGMHHKLFQKKSHTGDYVELPVHVRTSSAIGHGSSGSAYRDASREDYLKAAIFQKFLDGTVAIDKGALALARDGGAVRDVADDAIERFVNGFERFMSSIVMGDGTGKVGAIVDHPVGASNLVTVIIDMDEIFLPNLLSWDGAYLDVYNNTTFVETVRVFEKVAGVGPNGEFQVQLKVADATLAGDAWNGYDLYWRGTASGPSSYQNALAGLDGLLSNTGVLQNIDRADYPQYGCYIDANSAVLRNIDVEMIRRAAANASNRLGMNSPVGALIMNRNTYGTLDSIGDSLVRYEVSDGTVGRAVNRIQTNNGAYEMEPCNECPDSRAFGVDKSQLYCYEAQPLGWVDRGTGIFFPDTQTKQVIAHMEGIMENAIHDPRSSFKLIDLDSSDIRQESFS